MAFFLAGQKLDNSRPTGRRGSFYFLFELLNPAVLIELTTALTKSSLVVVDLLSGACSLDIIADRV